MNWILTRTRFGVLAFFVSMALLVSISAAEDKEHEKLVVGPASSYAFKQTSEGVTVAADVYETGDKVKAAFGKHNPYDSGILPVLLVIENNSAKAIRVDRMKVEYDTPQGDHIEPTPAPDLPYLKGAKQPKANPSPIPGLPGISRSKKNPLADWEVQGRAFAAQMIPPHDTASGFFYFQTGHRSGSKIYLSGIHEADSNRELLYFEIPLASVK